MLKNRLTLGRPWGYCQPHMEPSLHGGILEKFTLGLSSPEGLVLCCASLDTTGLITMFPSLPYLLGSSELNFQPRFNHCKGPFVRHCYELFPPVFILLISQSSLTVILFFILFF